MGRLRRGLHYCERKIERQTLCCDRARKRNDGKIGSVRNVSLRLCATPSYSRNASSVCERLYGQLGDILIVKRSCIQGILSRTNEHPFAKAVEHFVKGAPGRFVD